MLVFRGVVTVDGSENPAQQLIISCFFARNPVFRRAFAASQVVFLAGFLNHQQNVWLDCQGTRDGQVQDIDTLCIHQSQFHIPCTLQTHKDVQQD